jgi:hypothetical protein
MDEWLNSPVCNLRRKTKLRALISSEAASVGALFHFRRLADVACWQKRTCRSFPANVGL